MKLFYKKDYKVVLVEFEKLQGVYDELKKKYDNKDYKYLEEYNKYRDKAEQLEKVNKYHQGLIEVKDKDIEQISKKLNETINENSDLKTLVKELRGSKGGLTCQVNKLTKELEEAKTLIKEQKKELSKRYILKKVRGTMPEKQEMQLYSKQKTSEIIKKVKEKL